MSGDYLVYVRTRNNVIYSEAPKDFNPASVYSVIFSVIFSIPELVCVPRILQLDLQKMSLEV